MHVEEDCYHRACTIHPPAPLCVVVASTDPNLCVNRQASACSTSLSDPMPCLLQLKANQLEAKPEGALAQISMAHAQVCHKWSQELVLDLLLFAANTTNSG
eukprot:SAG31_NODE_4057_length_3630_cov_3.786746_2_plen_101_part_00